MYKFINGKQTELSAEEEQEIVAQQAECNARADEVLAEVVRSKRNEILETTDWLAIKSLELNLNLEKVHNYRQALRDIPQQELFPRNVVWPTFTM